MKIQKIRLLSKEELVNKKIALMREKIELLVLKKNQELKKTHRLRMVKRQIAQLNMIIQEIKS